MCFAFFTLISRAASGVSFPESKATDYKVYCLFNGVEVLRPSQPNWVMSSAVSLPNHTFTGQA